MAILASSSHFFFLLALWTDPSRMLTNSPNRRPPEASWHVDYRDTAYVYFGGLPYELTEGDVITTFSQFGEPVFLKLVRDPETGKSKGFGWLKYEDQRSADLAVDNLGGAEIGGRLVRVDHARYKIRDDEDPEEGKVGWQDIMRREGALREETGGDKGSSAEESEEEEKARPMLKEEKELQLLIQNHDDDDPMKAFLVEEKKQEVEEALRAGKKRSERHGRKHRDRRHRSHRSRRDDDDDGDRGKDERSDSGRTRKSRRDETPVESSRRDEDGLDEGRRRHRRSSRERGSRRDHDRDRDRDDDRKRRDPRDHDHDRKQVKEGRQRRHGREDSGDPYRADSRRSRSRSPRRS